MITDWSNNYRWSSAALSVVIHNPMMSIQLRSLAVAYMARQVHSQRGVLKSDKEVDMTKVNTVNFHNGESAVTRVRPGFEPFPKLTSRESNMSIKNFREDVQEIIDNVLVRLDDGSLDPNAACTRMFRCWIDGSYDGFEVYQANVSELRRIVFDGVTFETFRDARGIYAQGYYFHKTQNPSYKKIARQLRSWVGHQFTAYVAREVGCSYSTAQRYIVSGASAEDLAELTGELISDALELICDGITDDPTEAESQAFDLFRDKINQTYSTHYETERVVVGVQAVQA